MHVQFRAKQQSIMPFMIISADFHDIEEEELVISEDLIDLVRRRHVVYMFVYCFSNQKGNLMRKNGCQSWTRNSVLLFA